MKRIVLFLSILLNSEYLIAAYSCQVDVRRVLVYASGVINVLHSGRNDFTHICKLNGEFKGVDTVTCAMWASMLQNIQANGQRAIFYYNGDGSCETLPTYGSAPAPVYIGTLE